MANYIINFLLQFITARCAKFIISFYFVSTFGAKTLNVPVIAVVGGAEGDMQQAYQEGLSSVFTINRLPQDLSVSKSQSDLNLAFTMDNILRLIKTKAKNI